MKTSPYLVKTKLVNGEVERRAIDLIYAEGERQAGKQALINNCFSKPDFSEYPDEEACWDGSEGIYTVLQVKPLTEAQVEQYRSLTHF